MTRCFIYQDAKSQKFWNIEYEGNEYTVTYGRLGTAGQVQQKSLGSEAECLKAVEKLINEKIKKGYAESSAEAVANATDDAKRFGLSYDDQEENGKGDEDLRKRILGYKNLPTLKHMTIWQWAGAWEGGDSQDTIDWLIANSGKFPSLETLRMGDMESEDCELSWIVQGDYAKFWAAFPNLKGLSVQGGSGLSFGKIKHDKLESLEVVCGGLPFNIFTEVTEAQAPNLKKLNLYIGVEDYGLGGDIGDIKQMLAKMSFPKLEYLGICNSEIQDDIVEAVLSSKYAVQVNTLDFSKGVLTDKGAQIILDNAAKLTNLKFMDMSYHYITPEMQAKLKKLPFKTDLSDPQEYDTEHDYYNSPMFTE